MTTHYSFSKIDQWAGNAFLWNDWFTAHGIDPKRIDLSSGWVSRKAKNRRVVVLEWQDPADEREQPGDDTGFNHRRAHVYQLDRVPDPFPAIARTSQELIAQTKAAIDQLHGKKVNVNLSVETFTYLVELGYFTPDGQQVATNRQISDALAERRKDAA